MRPSAQGQWDGHRRHCRWLLFRKLPFTPCSNACRYNELETRWVAFEPWTYQVKFDAPEDVLGTDHVDLLLHGVDTFASIELNGETVGQVDNYHRCIDCGAGIPTMRIGGGATVTEAGLWKAQATIARLSHLCPCF